MLLILLFVNNVPILSRGMPVSLLEAQCKPGNSVIYQKTVMDQVRTNREHWSTALSLATKL